MNGTENPCELARLDKASFLSLSSFFQKKIPCLLTLLTELTEWKCTPMKIVVISINGRTNIVTSLSSYSFHHAPLHCQERLTTENIIHHTRMIHPKTFLSMLLNRGSKITWVNAVISLQFFIHHIYNRKPKAIYLIRSNKMDIRMCECNMCVAFVKM